MFKIDNPQNFHFQMKIRAEKVDKSDLRVICPCQLRNPNGTEGMQLSSFKGHSEKKKDKEKDTKHLNWLASLKSAITSVKSVIGITEVNRYWKHKYLFHTKRMTVYVFFPREQPNPCVLTYTITPSNAVDLIALPPLVPTFLNDIAEKLEMVSDILEPQAGNLDVFLLVSQARQTLIQWNDDAKSSTGESLHSLQPLELPELQRTETTSVEIGEEEDEEQDDDVPIQTTTSSTEVKPVPSSKNDDMVDVIQATKNIRDLQKNREKITQEEYRREYIKNIKILNMNSPIKIDADLVAEYDAEQELIKKQQQEEEPVATSSNTSASADDSIADLNEEHVTKILHDIYNFSDGDEEIYELIGFIQKNIQQKFKRGGKKLKEFFTWLHGYATTFYNNQLKKLTEEKKIDEAHEHLKEIEKLLSSFGRQ